MGMQVSDVLVTLQHYSIFPLPLLNQLKMVDFTEGAVLTLHVECETK